MNINKLQKLVAESKLNKVQIAERCGFTRVTLDNALQGADVKISTIESLASVLGVSVGYLFDDSTINQVSTGNSNIVVGRDNNGRINMAECQDKLDDALLEIKHLKERLKDKEEMIEILKSQLNK